MEPWFLNALQGLALITGVLGQWLVARRRRSAFVVWGASNVALVWVQLAQGLWLLAFMFLIYLFLCAYAYLEWGRSTQRGCA